MDTVLLVSALHAGATIVGTEIVKEATKDAYKSLKGAAIHLFGRRAERAIEKIESAPSDELSADELKGIVGPLSEDDSQEIAPKLQALLDALRLDSPAKDIVESVARIKLDVDAKGNITLDTIRGASDIDIKAKAGADFVMKDITMDPGPKRGN
jgi:hypothetical protein